MFEGQIKEMEGQGIVFYKVECFIMIEIREKGSV